jgi:hypothetical protein
VKICVAILKLLHSDRQIGVFYKLFVMIAPKWKISPNIIEGKCKNKITVRDTVGFLYVYRPYIEHFEDRKEKSKEGKSS